MAVSTSLAAAKISCPLWSIAVDAADPKCRQGHEVSTILALTQRCSQLWRQQRQEGQVLLREPWGCCHMRQEVIPDSKGKQHGCTMLFQEGSQESILALRFLLHLLCFDEDGCQGG
eukprot:2939674-Amphidinium_carterae.1